MFLIGLEEVDQRVFVLIRHLMFQKLHRLEDQNQFLLLEELLQISFSRLLQQLLVPLSSYVSCLFP